MLPFRHHPKAEDFFRFSSLSRRSFKSKVFNLFSINIKTNFLIYISNYKFIVSESIQTLLHFITTTDTYYTF